MLACAPPAERQRGQRGEAAKMRAINPSMPINPEYKLKIWGKQCEANYSVDTLNELKSYSSHNNLNTLFVALI
jgi:hypothetical protein